jgi:FkbM family methyltransferase
VTLVDVGRRIRGSRLLRNQGWLWKVARAPYHVLLRGLSRRRGITRRIAGEGFRWRYPYSEFDRDFEQPVQEAFSNLLRPGMTVLDIGASFGLYSLVAGRRVGERGRVFAFEPLPSALVVLRDHVALNRLTQRVEVVPMVVTDTPGEVELWEPARDRQASISKQAAVPHGGAAGAPLRRHVVSATTIDEFSTARGIEPDVIKIDVEGAEANVLRGARRFLERGKGHIILEAHPSALAHFGETTDGLLADLTDSGWTATEVYARGDPNDPAATLHYVCEPTLPPSTERR